jgi:SAM-dependent methyltransferase
MSTPAAFLLDHEALLREGSARGPILDLACGRGRNAVALAARGIDCVGVDRNEGFLREAAGAAREHPGQLETLLFNLESGLEIPVKPGSCGAILVFRFLFRPLAEMIERALAPGGLLLYETFTRDQPALGWGPKQPAFLLAPGELPTLFPALEVLHFDETAVTSPRPEASARLAARRPAS